MPRQKLVTNTPVKSQFGAPMGRANYFDAFLKKNPCPCGHRYETLHGPECWDTGKTITAHLYKVVMGCDGAYDKGGAYWGCGQTLYAAQNPDFFVIVRASNAVEAAEAIRETCAKYGKVNFTGKLAREAEIQNV